MNTAGYDFDEVVTDVSPDRWVEGTDGTLLGVGVHGDGPLTLLLCNGFSTTTFYWYHTVRYLSAQFRVITWDLKGHGHSAPTRDLSKVTVRDSAQDALRVLDACETERAVLLGFSLGSQVILEIFRAAPERVLALVSIFGPFGRPFDSFVHPKVGPIIKQLVLGVARHPSNIPFRLINRLSRTPIFWPVIKASGFINTKRLKTDDLKPFFEHYAHNDGHTFWAMASAIAEHDASDVLPTIDVPTLILGGGRDLFTIPAISEQFHRAIEGSEYLLVKNATHTGLLEYPRLLNQRIESFLKTSVMKEETR